MDYTDIILAPVVTEKTTELRDQDKYVFKVDKRATKIQIKEAVRRLFNVKVVGCTVINVRGKSRRMRYKAGMTPSWKKATVRLAQGETIKIFEGV
ncbi:MAG: 50S ribosomal protein L23 [Treponema sp.]|nr:MAG: 50S ribosomal protein L23 [Treponema sp.]